MDYWYHLGNNKQPVGPLSGDALLAYLRKVAGAVPVNKAGTGGWHPAEQWPELASKLGSLGQRQRAHLDAAFVDRQKQAQALQVRVSELAAEARQWQGRVDELKRDVEPLEEQVQLQAFGFYRPHYNLESSAEYAALVKDNRAAQKKMIKTEVAASFPKNFHVDGSYAEGLKMVRNQVRLMLRAFNGECDAAVAQVKYNNAVTLEKRIRKSFAAINKLGATLRISITEHFLVLKLDELRLVHEHREKVQLEREEQRAIKARMREEQRAEKEVLKAQKDAEEEERKREDALEAARREMEGARQAQQEKLEKVRRALDHATELERARLEKSRLELESRSDEQHARLEAIVKRMEDELSEALDRKAKAIARAQLTRSGHVYVISNIGSFGEGCFKIGLTRRLDPLDRVKELGDASVPFPFDVHAIIYSEDAPALEAALHRQFTDRRVNKVNTRKEYFRVSLAEIRQAVAKYHGIVTFVATPEAEEYRKTIALEAELEEAHAG